MFLKFGSKENIEDLYQNGTIFMKPIEWFRKHEDEFKNLRGDTYEGVVSIKNIQPGKFEIPTIGYQGEHLGIHLLETHEAVLGNLYCLYCISSRGWDNQNEIKVDSKLAGFGTHCLMVKDNQKFLALIREKLNEMKVSYYMDFVEYFNEKAINRKINLFEKRLEFAYQKEFRIYIPQNLIQDFNFKIGRLKGIAEVHLTVDIINGLTVGKGEKKHF